MKQMKAYVFAGCVALLGMIGCVGCVTTHSAPADRRVTIAPDVSSSVWVTDVRYGQGASDHYTLQANVVNTTSSIQKLKYRVVWLNGEGIEIASTTANWQDISISGKDIAGLKAVAPIPGLLDFRIHIKAGE